MKCTICGEERHNLSNHVILKHGISPKNYFDTYLKTFDNSHCRRCGCELTFIKLSVGYGKYCNKCGRIVANEKIKNMSDEVLQLRKERRIATCMKKYGVEHPMHDKTIADKITAAAKKRTPEQQQLVHEHHLAARAKIDVAQMNSRIKETKLNRHGDANYNNIEQAKQTYYERTGYTNPYYNPDVIEHRFDDYEKRTGYANPSHNPEVISKMRKKYTYNEIGFDSSWELAYYIWLKDHDLTFKFHQTDPIEYEYAGKTHKYFPDFETTQGLVEIKNPKLLERMYESGTLDNAKYECMVKHNVKIITDCREYLEYVELTYGKDYLKQFRNL